MENSAKIVEKERDSKGKEGDKVEETSSIQKGFTLGRKNRSLIALGTYH